MLAFINIQFQSQLLKLFCPIYHSEVQLKHSAALSIISPFPFVLAWMIMDMCGQQVTPLRSRNEASSEGG